MEQTKELKNEKGLFERFDSEIDAAYERAVRVAILRHKRNGESIVIERDGKMVILTADEIDIS